jgi:hypothetical protein
MENFILNEDIKVFCETASSFPDGVLAVHQKMHSIASFTPERKYFGLSRPNEKGAIVYKAGAAELFPGELEKYKLEEIIVKKGNYISFVVRDFMNDISAIGQTFQKMLSSTDIDPQGWCVEWYFNEKDVRCMVRLK